MKAMKKIIFLLLFTTIITFAQAQTSVFYVAPDGNDENPGTKEAPFTTLQRAQEAIRNLKKQDEIEQSATVYLRGGYYFLEKPLLLTPEDAGTEKAPVTYRAFENETPILSGGKKITGWKKGQGNMWTVTLPEVKNGDWKFRQLYVNGELRHRARMPDKGFFTVAGFPCGGSKVHYHTDCQQFEFAPGDINPAWTNLEDVEVIVYHFWTDSHLPIESIDTTTNVVTFKHKAGKVFTDDFSDKGARYIIENVKEGLDQPGEWYLDTKTGVLSYIPLPGEDMESAEVIAPVTPEFIRMEGKPLSLQFVEHLSFEGISFMYTNWDLSPGNSNDRQGSASVPAAITLTGARHCRFHNCTVKNIGTFAFEVDEGSTHNQFTFNEISYLAAGGFRINGDTEEGHPLLRTGFNVISDNTLHHYGETFPSAVGVLLMQTEGNRVTHNHIHHGWYTGISIGWEWGYQRSISRDNVVAYNHIHDIGQGLLSDMGAIYTLGVSPGTVIRNNLIHDVNSHHYGGWGIYNDEGSTHILIENNIVYNTKFSAYNIHFAKEITVRNNIFALAQENQLSRSRTEPHKSVFFENNIVYWKEGKLLQKDWEDKPYTFHFHPKNEKGTREVSSTFDIDWNLYFNPTLPKDSVNFGSNSWSEWQARGKDEHSMYADPQFVDAENYDFRLKEESPAFQLGFRSIDMSRLGPRKPEEVLKTQKINQPK